LLGEPVHQFFGFGKDVIGIGAGHLLNGDTRSRKTVERAVGRVGIRAEFDPGHIPQLDDRSVTVRFDDDILIIFVLVELALVFQDIFVHFFAALTETAGCSLQALILDSIGHFKGERLLATSRSGLSQIRME